MGGVNWRTLPGGSGPSALLMWFGRWNRENCSMITWQAEQQLGGYKKKGGPMREAPKRDLFGKNSKSYTLIGTD